MQSLRNSWFLDIFKVGNTQLDDKIYSILFLGHIETSAKKVWFHRLFMDGAFYRILSMKEYLCICTSFCTFECSISELQSIELFQNHVECYWYLPVAKFAKQMF